MTTIINVADLAPPAAVEALNFETIVDRQKAAFQEYWEAVREANPTLNLPPYDVLMLESDPNAILNEAESYRELLLRARVNDAVRAVLPAFAKGTDLENIAARANVSRLVTATDDEGAPTAWESDAQLLNRYLAAFAAPAAGSEDGYIYQAATAWPQRHDIKAYNYATEVLGLSPGDVAVYLLAANGAAVSDETVTLVARALGPETGRPMTDVVSVRKATVKPWTLTAKLILPRGASPASVLAGRETAIRAFADRRYHIGGLVTEPGAVSALWEPNVINVTNVSVTGLDYGVDKAPFLTAINLTYEVQG